jgi:hypothetical protein
MDGQPTDRQPTDRQPTDRQLMDAMQFFQNSAGQWRSLRTTHHLAFRRTEKGESEISVEALAANDPKVAEICRLHDIDPATAIGGADVRWQGTMAWDKQDDENHTGSTVFALVPDDAAKRSGQMLRERGYAEIVPVVGQFHMDAEDGLILITDYETMSSIERFSFASPNLRMRTSTVKRFGGFSTATFCTEFRVEDAAEPTTETTDTVEYFSMLGW